MKILYLAHADNYHIVNWQQKLTQKGVHVQLCSFRKNANLHPIPVEIYAKSNLRWYHFPQKSGQLPSLTSSFKPDLIFSSFASTYGLMAQLSGINVPKVVQTWSRDIALPGSLKSPTDYLHAHSTSPWVLRKCDGITTDGVQCKNHLLSRFPSLASKTLATPWGIDLNFFTPTGLKSTLRRKYHIPDEALVLNSVRGLFWYYQPEIVLPALLRLLQENPRLYVILLGLGHSLQQRLAPILEQLSTHPRVRFFPDLVEKNKIRELWEISDFFLSIPRFDGVSEAISEGRAMGAIPLLNGIPSNLERCKPDEHAFYVDDSSEKTLMGSIRNALNTSDERLERMRKSNLDWVRKSADVDRTIESLISFFEERIHFYRSNTRNTVSDNAGNSN